MDARRFFYVSLGILALASAAVRNRRRARIATENRRVNAAEASLATVVDALGIPVLPLLTFVDRVENNEAPSDGVKP